MYTINEFSKLSNVSVSTLRYYDEIDLFKPSYTDFYSGYRYYIDDQLATISIIKKLKDIDISLNEIKEYLQDYNVNILLKQREKYQDKLKKVEEIINMQEVNNYEVIPSDYKKYIEVNGTKQIKSPMAIEIRNNNAEYYLINKNNEFYDDFAIYKENNCLTLDCKYFNDKNLIECIFDFLKSQGYDYVLCYIPIEDEGLWNYIKSNYKITHQKIKQGSYEYYSVKYLL